MPSKSKSQRRLFGLVYSIKKAGKNSDNYKEASSEIKNLVDTMSFKQLRDFISIDETELPDKIDEKIGYIKSFNEYCSNISSY